MCLWWFPLMTISPTPNKASSLASLIIFSSRWTIRSWHEYCMLCGIAWTQAEELLQPSVRDRRMQEIYTALRTHPEDLQQELESFFEMIREDYGYDAEYVKNLFVQTAMIIAVIAFFQIIFPIK